MQHYQFSGVEVTGQFISANVYVDDNYIMKIGAETLHIQYTGDIEDRLYKEFRLFALNYLGGFIDEEKIAHKTSSARVIHMWDYKQKPL